MNKHYREFQKNMEDPEWGRRLQRRMARDHFLDFLVCAAFTFGILGFLFWLSV